MNNRARLKAGFRIIAKHKILILVPIIFTLSIIFFTYQGNIFIINNVTKFTQLYNAIFTILMFELLILGNLGICALFGLPHRRKKIEKNIAKVEFSNNAFTPPILLSKTKNNNSVILEFFSDTLPLSSYQNRTQEIETALNVKINSIEQGRDKRHTIINCTSGRKQNERSIILWSKQLISPNDFELILGESYLGTEKIDINCTPHILVGGGTGSGKTVLLKLILLQCIEKGATVFLADFKGGVDFSSYWHNNTTIITNGEELNRTLEEIINILEERRNLLISEKVPNIFEYNQKVEKKMKRIVVCCDEIAEVLDKTGLNKEEKALVNEIESKISTIARLGRAFGIHLILSTQRPDAEILKGQIKINIGNRICGRADKILSQIILDNSEASDKISPQDQGVFLTNTNVLFKAYYFDETSLNAESELVGG